MTEVIKLTDARRRRAEGKSLCRAGFHKWRRLNATRFDVKRGRLLTAERCRRCGQTRTRLT